MKQKNLKKMIAPLSAVVALSVGAYLGIDDVTQLENSISAIFTGVVTIVGILGVWANNDK